MARATSNFYPLLIQPWLVKPLQTIAPLVTHYRYRVDLDIAPEDLHRLIALKHQRRLILPNHPTFHDPIVLFLLSARLRQTLYYLAAIELFQGWLGWLMPRVGVYSIQRGVADRTSIAYTLDLMAQSECGLVIFPEGGCSFQNDTVIPFRPGAIQLAFQALNRFARQGEAIPDFFAIPLSIKYRYTQDMTGVIQTSLEQLEAKLGLAKQGTDYDRLRAIAAMVLSNLEQEYGLSSVESDNLDDRIAALKAHVLAVSEHQLGLPSPLNEPDRERVYRVQHQLRDLGNTPHGTGWSIAQAMFRLLNFDAIYDGYVAANPTPERFLDTLTRLERAVFEIDQPVPKGNRIAQVRVGEPINLKDQFADYQQNRSATVAAVTQTIQQSVQASLSS